MIIRGGRRLARRGLLRVSRSRPGARLVATVARSAPRLIPRRIAIMDDVLIFKHPVPAAGVHLIAVPRGQVADAHAVGRLADGFWIGLDNWLSAHATGFGVAAGVTNVGTRQDVRLLHVHLLGDPPGWLDSGQTWRGGALLEAVDGIRKAAPERPVRSWASYGFRVATGADWKVSRIEDAPEEG
jgi:diadenosine tetraphosphate (Ap4A) HIT family hydrolase